MKVHVNVHKAVGGVSRVAITVYLAVLAIVFVIAYSVGNSTANPRKARLLMSSEIMLKSETQSLQQCEDTLQSMQNGVRVTVEGAIKIFERQVAAAGELHRLEQERVALKRSVVQQCRDEVSELRLSAFGATADNMTAHLDVLRAKRDDLLVQHATLTNVTEVLRQKQLLVLQTALVQQLTAANKTAHRARVCAAATVRYCVVFDLGSSGNRVHVYKYAVIPQAATTPGAARDLISEINLTEELFELNQRALSKLPDPVAEAPAALRELYDHAKAFVPADLHDCTPVEFKATAGLRMLGPEKATEILAAIRRAYMNETFWMRGSSPVRILDGSEEGPMAWLTVNFLLGAFSKAANTASVAVIDLGGGSTQVVFEPTEDVFARVPTHQRFTATLGNRPVRAYQHSYEGYGLHSATRELLFHIQGKSQPRPPKPTAAPATTSTATPAQGGLVRGMFGGGEQDGDSGDGGIISTTMSPLPDPVAVEAFPCFAVDYTDTLGVSNTKRTEAGAPVTGPDFAACVALFRDRLLKPSGVNCTAGHCGIASVFQPPFADFTGDIYAFSFIFDLLDVANATHLAASSDKFMAKLADFRKIGAERCSSLTLQSIQAARKSGSLQPAYDCMYYAYVYALLRYGYGIAEDRQLHVAKKIRSYETAWTLGASLMSLA